MDTIRPQDSPVNEVRARLAKKLRRPDVPDWLWSELEKAGLLAPGLSVDLVHESRRRLRRIRSSAQPAAQAKGTKAISIRSLFTPAEEERASAFSEYIGSLASENQDLQQFRNEVLDGRKLTREEAEELLRSQALRYSGAQELRGKGIPIDGHRVLEHDYKTGPVTEEAKDGSKLFGYRHEAVSVVSWSGGRDTLSGSREYFPATPEQVERDQPRLHLPHPTGSWVPVQIWSGSVLDEVRRISNSLKSQFPWNEPEATLYVLTGKPPFIPPIAFQPEMPRRGSYQHVRLTLSVEPWVSTATVTRVYGHLKKLAYTRKSRALNERNLRLFRFVTRHALPGTDAPGFHDLMVKWNAEYPEEMYRSAWLFARDYRRVGEAVAFPRYEFLRS